MYVTMFHPKIDESKTSRNTKYSKDPKIPLANLRGAHTFSSLPDTWIFMATVLPSHHSGPLCPRHCCSTINAKAKTSQDSCLNNFAAVGTGREGRNKRQAGNAVWLEGASGGSYWVRRRRDLKQQHKHDAAKNCHLPSSLLACKILVRWIYYFWCSNTENCCRP